jgi:hypothetical protein
MYQYAILNVLGLLCSKLKVNKKNLEHYLYRGSLMIIFIACSHEALDGTRWKPFKGKVKISQRYRKCRNRKPSVLLKTSSTSFEGIWKRPNMAFFFFNDTKGWTQSLTYARKACYHMSHSPSPGFETGSHFMPTAWTVIYLFVLLCLSGMTVVGIPHPAFSWDGGGGVSHELFARFGLEPRSSQSLPLK